MPFELLLWRLSLADWAAYRGRDASLRQRSPIGTLHSVHYDAELIRAWGQLPDGFFAHRLVLCHPRLVVAVGPRAAVGSLCFRAPDAAAGTVEVGYGIAPAWRGRGYATEALRLALNELPINFTRIIAHTAADNLASQRVLKRNGFTQTHRDEDFGILTFERVR